MLKKTVFTLSLVFSLIFFVSSPATAANSTTPGELIVEPATLNSLGFEWHISGDDNINARVELEYRKTGTSSWKRGMDLHRTKNNAVGPGNELYEWTTGNTFAGSILFLEPGTSYDVRLKMIDPDGSLNTTREITTSTYSLPTPNPSGNTHHVYTTLPANPSTPSYTSISQAINTAQPGDTVLIHPGTYNLTQTNGVVINNQGTSERTIYVRAAKLGDVTLSGNGSNTLINIQNAANITFENLIFRNSFRAIFADEDFAQQPSGITVHNNVFYMSDDGNKDLNIPKAGVYCRHQKCQHFVILNNTFIGPNTDNWTPRVSYYGVTYGVQLVGRGHVLGFNQLKQFWDGLNLDGFQPPADKQLRTSSVDFFNNYITEMVDDAIQTDSGAHNIRVYENFIHNLFMGISAQPIYGGPAYIYRNVVYNYTRSPVKLNVQPSGVWVVNNTFIGEQGFKFAYGWTNSKLVNNLVFPKDNDGNGFIHTGTSTPSTIELDYNGYYQHKTDQLVYWQVPDSSKDIGYSGKYYHTFDSFRNATGYEQHGRLVTYSIFNNVPKPPLNRAPLPSNIDFRLKSGSNAVDAGKVIIGLNESYIGSKPDLGAYELGQSVPHYGPKPVTQLPGFTTSNTHLGVDEIPSPTPSSPIFTPTPTRTPTPTPLPSGEMVRVFEEAENGQISAPMTTGNDVEDSVTYVSSSTGSSGSVEMTFDIPESAEYIVWARVQAPTVSSNSFFVQIDDGSTLSVDGQAEDSFDIDENIVSDEWQWVRVSGRGGTSTQLAVNPRIFNLSAGQHTITFRQRDASTALDKIMITNDLSPEFSETGSGGNGGYCSEDVNSDGVVDLTDYSILVSNFFRQPVLNARADINKDGIVDLTDYSILVAKFFYVGTCN